MHKVIIQHLQERITSYPWLIGTLSRNTEIPLEIIRNNMQMDWNWRSLTRRFSWNTIKNNFDLPWCHYEMSMKPEITWGIVQEYGNINWDWDHFKEPGQTLDVVLRQNPNITWSCIEQISGYPLDWDMISSNKNITLDVIVNNPGMPWVWGNSVWGGTSRNPNLTWEFVKYNLDKDWDWDIISARPDMFSSEQDMFDVYKRHIAALRIQKYWRWCISDPRHDVCQRRLLRELAEW